MDLRERKTKRSINNAFLQLRKAKPLERITVKELAELAEISKATFYLHYRDIYDLSDSLQEEVTQNILASIRHPEYFLQDRRAFTEELFHAFYAQQSLINTLFSGLQSHLLPDRIEKELRNYIHKLLPEADLRLDMLLTYQIQGGFAVAQAYHKQWGMDTVIQLISEFADAIPIAMPNMP